MTHLSLRLFGVPEVTLDGQPVALARRSSLALLAYLAVSGGTHPRDPLTALFGGDGSEEQARRRLSNALADLRQHLAPCLLSSWHVLGVRTDVTCWSDVQAFNDLLSRARDSETADPLREAADLYRGEFLAGLNLPGAPDFEMWLLLQRESLHAQFVQTLESLTGSAMRRAAWTEGAWAAQRLVQLEPWHEEAHRQLMICLARSGQRQVALAQFETCRRLLREELDAEPSRETIAVYEDVRHQSSVPNNVPLPATPTIGREAEIELLCERLSQPATRLLSVVGPHGSGKTHLVCEVAARLVRGAPSTRPVLDVDGVFVVDMRGATDADTPGRISRALGLVTSGEPRIDELTGQLALHRLIVVLDGVDNGAALAPSIHLLLAHVPRLRLVVTALAPLRVDGEHVLTLGGLDLPARPEDLERAPASALLLAEAQRADMRFKLAPGMRPSLVQLCHLVHGLPLGLVLAARAMAERSSATLVNAIESALTVPVARARKTEPWWSSPQWASILDTLEILERPTAIPALGALGRARGTTPLALVCTPDSDAETLVEDLRHEGLVVCVTHDFNSCLRVATTVGPDVVVIDPRLPRRLEQLLRAHPISCDAVIRWVQEPTFELTPALAGAGAT